MSATAEQTGSDQTQLPRKLVRTGVRTTAAPHAPPCLHLRICVSWTKPEWPIDPLCIYIYIYVLVFGGVQHARVCVYAWLRIQR